MGIKNVYGVTVMREKREKKKPNQIFSTTLKLQDSENPLGFYFLPVYPVPLRASTTYI